MKRLLLLTAIVLMSVLGMSQTTQEEYNYCTKGIKAQYANGLDMKKGYSLDLYETIPISKDLNLSYYLLKKDVDKQTTAIVVVYGPGINSTYSAFYCIPSIGCDKSIWAMFFESVSDAKTPAHITVILKGTSLMLSKALTSK